MRTQRMTPHTHVRVLALTALLLTLAAACSTNTSTARRPTPTAASTATASPTSIQPPVYPTPPGPPFTLYYRSTDLRVYALRSTDLSTRWSYSTTTWIEDMASGDGALYVGYDGFTVALDAASGTRRWTATWHEASSSGIQHTPTLVVGAGLVFASGGSTLVALRASDGHLLWQRTLQGVGRPVVAGGVLYVTDDYSPSEKQEVADLYALRASDGATLWSVGIPPAGSDGFAGGGSYCYISKDGVLRALALANGRQVWQFRSPDSDLVTFGDSLAVADGVAYLITSQHLYAFQAASGALRWQDEIGIQNEFSIYPTATADGRLFLAGGIGRGGGGSFLDAINAVDGSERWLNSDNYDWTSAPIVVGDTLWDFGVPEAALVRAASGTVFAAYTLPAPPLGGLILVGP